MSTDPLQVHAILAPNTPDQPLHIAAWQNRVKIARLLIAAGADLNARGLHGWTPLHYAAHHGSPTVAQVLINSGADINQKDEVGFTPLFKATRSREPEAARIEQMLVKAGAIVDLNTAVCLGDLQRIHQILAADPDAVQHAPFPLDLVYDAVIAINGRLGRECPVGDDWTPEKAQNVLIKYRPLLDMLIEHGADIDGIGFAGRPPLFVAVQMDHPLIAEILLHHGANVNYRIREGRDAWHVASNPRSAESVRQLLMKYGFTSP
ncbi:MAG: ankyrin repeat domain-containing protein [Chloroflexota bacterium]|nr:ankyrin repeat domain-containing protein [Chloroflexota bacterium]